MNKAEALQQLSDTSSHARLQAARILGRLATKSDLPALRAHLREEQVSFVRRALEQVIERVSSGKTLQAPSETRDSEGPDRDSITYSRAVDFVTTSLLHEISPHVGAIKVEARKAVADYDESALRRSIDGLDAVLSGLEELRKATVSESQESIKLYDLIQEIAEHETKAKRLPISVQGRRDLVVTADPNLLRIAISNGLRNAIEATTATGWVSPIVVNFNETEIDYWITILDSGPGVTGPTEPAFEFGRTTKSGHRGFGLALARQAMITLDGTIVLEPAASGGARLEIRWFK